MQNVLESLLDKYDQPGKVIRIEKLELDISDIEFTPAGLPFLTDALRQRLDEQLSEQLFSVHLDETLTENKIANEKINIKIYDESDDVLELTIYFFKHGYLPWWASHFKEVNINYEVNKMLAHQPDLFIKLVDENLKNSTFRKRLVNQLDKSILNFILKKLPDLHYTIHEVFIELVSNAIERKDILKYLDLIGDSKATNSSFRNITLLASLLNHSQNLNSFSLKEFMNHHLKNHDSGKLIIGAISKMSTLTHRQKVDMMYPFIGKHPDLLNKKTVDVIVNLGSEKNEIEETTPRPVENSEDENFISVQHAGLIILQPYLLPFFMAIKLVDGSDFLDQKSQHHAAYLLHYLATGNDDQPEEHLMTLNKLLCGIDLEEPLEEFQKLSENEKSECTELLKSIIENWPAIKTTSVDGLREMFLKRSGNLRREPNGWNLYIERETHDILLDKLPWGISMLKASWNEQMIYVEW